MQNPYKKFYFFHFSNQVNVKHCIRDIQRLKEAEGDHEALFNAAFDSETSVYTGKSGSFKVESTGYKSEKLKDEFLTKLIDNIESRYLI